MSAVGADELVSRWVDRFLLRRKERRTHVDNVDLESDDVLHDRTEDETAAPAAAEAPADAHEGERRDG
jgi:hypothetical protein